MIVMFKSNKLALAGIFVAVAAFSVMGCRSPNNPTPTTFNSAPTFSQQGSGTAASAPAAGSGGRPINPAYSGYGGGSGYSSGGSGSR